MNAGADLTTPGLDGGTPLHQAGSTACPQCRRMRPCPIGSSPRNSSRNGPGSRCLNATPARNISSTCAACSANPSPPSMMLRGPSRVQSFSRPTESLGSALGRPRREIGRAPRGALEQQVVSRQLKGPAPAALVEEDKTLSRKKPNWAIPDSVGALLGDYPRRRRAHRNQRGR